MLWNALALVYLFGALAFSAVVGALDEHAPPELHTPAWRVLIGAATWPLWVALWLRYFVADGAGE